MILLANASTSNTTEDKQVRVFNFYDKGWEFILRPPKNIANGLAFYAEKLCENNNVLYSQEKRYSLYNTLKCNNFDINCITDKVYCDCSSFVGTCICGNGIQIDLWCFTTSTMRNELIKKGFQAIKFSDKSQLIKGDILLKEGSHTVIVVEAESSVSKTKTVDKNGTVFLNDKNSYLNVREKPSTNSKVVGTLNYGDIVKILGQSGNWYQIKAGVLKGYCSKNYIR